LAFYDGFFGPGTGTFLILIYTSLLHYDFVKANGNTKVVNLASNVAALITFSVSGHVYLPLAILGQSAESLAIFSFQTRYSERQQTYQRGLCPRSAFAVGQSNIQSLIL
jgi:hypothetical protein